MTPIRRKERKQATYLDRIYTEPTNLNLCLKIARKKKKYQPKNRGVLKCDNL